MLGTEAPQTVFEQMNGTLRLWFKILTTNYTARQKKTSDMLGKKGVASVPTAPVGLEGRVRTVSLLGASDSWRIHSAE